MASIASAKASNVRGGIECNNGGIELQEREIERTDLEVDPAGRVNRRDVEIKLDATLQPSAATAFLG